MKSIVYTPGSIVTINREIYELEAVRTVRGSRPPLAGRYVFSLLKIKDGTRWRTTGNVLDRTTSVRMVCVGRVRRLRREALSAA